MKSNKLELIAAEYLNCQSVVIYGYGHFGKLLEAAARKAKISYTIVDDNSGSVKLESLQIDKNTKVALCVHSESVRAEMEKKCINNAYTNIINDLRFLELLDAFGVDIGYYKANSGKIFADNCPVCGGDSSEIYINLKEYSIRECCICAHQYVGNLPSLSDVNDFYDDIGYFEQNYKISLDDFHNERFVNFAKNRAQMISKFLPKQIEECAPLKILEIGCLDGRLLWYLKQFGHEAYGNEINKHVAKIATEQLKLDIRTDELDLCGYEDGYFDIIFSCHVMEHLADPALMTKSAKKYLKKGGMFIANLPLNETDYENFHHLHFFSGHSIFRLLYDIFENASVSKGFQYKVHSKFFDTADICAKNN